MVRCEMKKTDKNESQGTALGMCFGLCLGMALGSAFDNISMGMCFGLAIGVAFGALKDRQVNRQLKEKGYRVKAIEEKNGGAEYAVTIEAGDGETCVITLPGGQMESEGFAVGDTVYLDEDGLLEQAFDKDEE